MSYDDIEQEDCSTPESSRYERTCAMREAAGLPSLTSDQRSGLRQLVERSVAVRRWHGSHADVDCPGQHLHTGKSDCARVYIGGRVPFLHCLHRSCAEAVAEVNRTLCSETLEYFGAEGIKLKPTPEEKAELAFRKRLRVITASARNTKLAKLLKEPGIALEAWIEASPVSVDKVPVTEHWRLLVAGLFDGDPHPNSSFPYHPPDLWIGDLHESGWLYEDRFRTAKTWLKQGKCPGPMICPAEFNDGTFQLGDSFTHREGRRKKDFIAYRRYMVCESDTLSVESFGRVVYDLMRFLTLRAVVHTGGKSIHCWFDAPRFELSTVYESWRMMQAMLTGLGCDPGMFGFASTARLPGCLRADRDGNQTDQWQHLLFLNPKYPVNS